MDGCAHCHNVLEELLPPIQWRYEEQLEIKLIVPVGGEEVVALYKLTFIRSSECKSYTQHKSED
jgi:hypothetical protein